MRDPIRRADVEAFGAIAAAYEQNRPDYPCELFDVLERVAELKRGSAILEVGAGTGKATLEFARRGFRVDALERSAEMLRVAGMKLRDFPAARTVCGSFPEWEPDRRYDLVACAQAFHWLPEPASCERAAGCLRQGGSLAAFWNIPTEPAAGVWAELEASYRKSAPELAAINDESRLEPFIASQLGPIAASGRFTNPTTHRFPWNGVYAAKQYIDLLNTFADHLAVPEPARRQLFADIRRIIENHGDRLVRPYVAVLIHACALPPGAP